MRHVGFDIGPSSRKAPIGNFPMDLSRIETTLAQACKDVILIGVELAGPQGTRGWQRWLWCLANVFSDRSASQAQFFTNLPQAHPAVMELVYSLIQLPLAQKSGL